MSKRLPPSITTFFAKKRAINSQHKSEPEAEMNLSVEILDEPTSQAHRDISHVDIATAVDQILTREDKYKFITNHFTPSEDFNWPFEVRKSHGREEKRYLRAEHLEKN